MSPVAWANPPAIFMLRNHKQLLFATLGFGGGTAGALIAELAPEFGQGPFALIGSTALWTALAGSIVAVALFAASEIYHRRRGYLSKAAWRYLGAGAVGGAIAGATAQAVFGARLAPPLVQELLVRPFCWGLMGAILGWRLAATIPNLAASRGAIGGAIGGTVGGIAFIITSIFLPDILGRLSGIGLLGAALGLALVVVDAIFCEATLEIVWAPKEVTSVSLGPVPVTIGGGEDHIHVVGLPATAASVVMNQGKIQYIDTASQQRTDLRDGSRIKIGSIEVIVHARR